MPRYLSPEWFAAAQHAAAGNAALQTATAGAHVVVEHEITGGPDGDVRFHVVVDHGRVEIVNAPAEAPTVTFVQNYETAAAIGRGELSAQGAFLTGNLRVRGDLPRLVDELDAFGGVDDLFDGLRAQTDY
jgi:putative sterol carrier protein